MWDTVAVASAVYQAILALKWEASWVPRVGSNHDGGDAVGDGDHGGDSAHVNKTACTAPGWPPTGIQDCLLPVLPL